MAFFDTSRSAYGSSVAVYSVVTFFSELAASIAAWNDARLTRNALAGLTDRELEDIGLCRGDINVVASANLIR